MTIDLREVAIIIGIEQHKTVIREYNKICVCN